MGQGSPFALYVIIGFVVLGLVLAFAMLRNRKRDRGQDAAADAATRAGYNEADVSARTDEDRTGR